ncbi:hypothetical protein CRENPOLYSF1_770045 [Crenothrix polyspora]|uniref:Uncharacterized protein n=1 Tax=Crenothrix polyspora TaxID=360316 RepID=A0A1R4HHN5_9GAMM|nr:hypothetical protein CRENPOLYSF1_770045 [Crenothrix polyspora]
MPQKYASLSVKKYTLKSQHIEFKIKKYKPCVNVFSGILENRQKFLHVF